MTEATTTNEATETETGATENTAAPKKAAKKAAKKAPTAAGKKAPAKAAEAAPAKAAKKALAVVKSQEIPPVAEGEKAPALFGVTRAHDVPWSEKKVALFKALTKLSAFNKTDARGATDIIKASGETLNGRDVRHYSYHAKAAGLVEVVEGAEGVHGYAFYLTAKGQKVDPAAELKKKLDAKKAE